MSTFFTDHNFPHAQLAADWVVGIVDGEGCFCITIALNQPNKLGYIVMPEFVVTQHRREHQILHSLRNFFGCGHVDALRPIATTFRNAIRYRVANRLDLHTKIVPFFDAHNLLTQKHQSFLKWRYSLELMSCGRHLTQQGLAELQTIAADINPSGHSERRKTNDGTTRTRLPQQADVDCLHSRPSTCSDDRRPLPHVDMPTVRPS